MENLNYNDQCKTFARFGFVEPPLSESDLIKVINAGLIEQVYAIGCDLFCGAFDSIEEAINWYTKREA